MLSYATYNIAIEDVTDLTVAQASGDYGSYLRVVATSSGTSSVQVAFDVEGISSDSVSVHVANADDSSTATCSFIGILEEPIGIALPAVDWSQPLSAMHPPPAASFQGRFRVQAMSSYGVALPGVNVSMVLVDTAGLLMYYAQTQYETNDQASASFEHSICFVLFV